MPGSRRTSLVVAACALVTLALAALSTLVVAAAPSYDPWAWLLWGREVARGELSTPEGPAFKPLPVAVTAALSPLGDAAPWCWVVIVRASAIAALALAFLLARRLSGGSTGAGILGLVAVALCGSFMGHTAAGAEPALVLAAALGAGEAWRRGHYGWALAGGIGCALLRVEAWPFLGLAMLVLWRDRRIARPALAAWAIAVPALWFGPELWGSGDVLRSGSRARMPNPGQPALAAVPALASVQEAARLALWPLWAGLAWLVAQAVARAPRDPAARAAARAALAPAVAGAAWVAVVAVMAQAGFSGEGRYAMPGVALISLSAAVGLWSAAAAVARRTAAATPPMRAATVAAACAVVAVAAVPKLIDLAGVARSQSYQRRLGSDLDRAIALAGGRDRVLRCGGPIVGDLRGPLMAYHLDVHKHVVRFAARGQGVVFRSRRSRRAEIEPVTGSAYASEGHAGLWEVRTACVAGGRAAVY